MLLLIKSETYYISFISDQEKFPFNSFGFSQQWYMLAMTLAEEAAWTSAKENGIDLVIINPGFVIGTANSYS